ncbi:MAG: glycosyltransferase family 4 protein [Paludibacter sp.]|nr:glycosyltransferase family 4 protein [Paludibacter sp.]
MNIFLDNIVFSLQKQGGISVFWYEFLKRIMQDADFDCKFIDLPNDNIFRKQLDIPLSDILDNRLNKLPVKVQRYVNPTIKEEGIFHSSYYRVSNGSQVCNVTTVHDFTYEYYFKGLPKFVHHFQKKNAILNSKKIICVSNNTKTDLLRFYPNLNERQIEVIYNGVSDDYFPLHTRDSAFLNNTFGTDFKEYVLFVGKREDTYKNFDMVVDACKLTKSKLLIVGGGYLSRSEVAMLDVQLGLHQYKQIAGVANVQLNEIYNNASFLVYPSLYEGFGISILEAQKSGCPVICSNTSSIPEIAGKGAYLLEKISALKIADILLQNKSRNITKLIIDEGYLNSQFYSWDKCYQETKQVYQDMYTEFI